MFLTTHLHSLWLGSSSHSHNGKSCWHSPLLHHTGWSCYIHQSYIHILKSNSSTVMIDVQFWWQLTQEYILRILTPCIYPCRTAVAIFTVEAGTSTVVLSITLSCCLKTIGFTSVVNEACNMVYRVYKQL